MAEYIVRIPKDLAEIGKQLKRGLSWKLPTAFSLVTLLSACAPAVEQQSSAQSVNIIFPNSAKENLGLTPQELDQLKSIKGDFMEQANTGNVLGFALDASSKNEKLTPQQIIANNLSKASGVNITADQIDAPNDEVTPMLMSIGEKNLPMISQTYNVQIEGEEKPRTLLFFYTKEDEIWRQTGFIIEKPTFDNAGNMVFKFNSQLDITEGNSFTNFGMVIASNSDPKLNNVLTFSNIDGKPVIVETFPNGSQLIGFLPENDFFQTGQNTSTNPDALVSFKINSAITQIPPIEATLTPAVSTATPEASKTPVPLEFGATVEEVYKGVYKDDVTKGSEMFDKLNESIKTGEITYADLSGTNIAQGKGKISKEQLAKADAFKTTDSNFPVVTNIEVTNEKGQTFTVAWNSETNKWVRVTKLNAEAADYDEYTRITGQLSDLDIIIFSQGTKDNHPYADPFKGSPPNVLRWINLFPGLRNEKLSFMYLDYTPLKVAYNPGWEEGRFVEGNLPWRFAPTVRWKTTSGKEILLMTQSTPISPTSTMMEHDGVDKKAFDDFKNQWSGLNLVDYLKNTNSITGEIYPGPNYITPAFPFPEDIAGWDINEPLYSGGARSAFPNIAGLQKQGEFFDLLPPEIQDGIREAVPIGELMVRHSFELEITPELAKFLSQKILYPRLVSPQY